MWVSFSNQPHPFGGQQGSQAQRDQLGFVLKSWALSTLQGPQPLLGADCMLKCGVPGEASHPCASLRGIK